MAKKLLLVTYYWPPAGGVAVQRWLHMTYHLAELGWQITVFHPKKASYPSFDESNKKWIHPSINFIQLPINEPAKYYNLLNGKQNQGGTQIFKDNKGWWKNIALKLRAEQFIPDARMLWIKPATKFLEHYLHTNPQDILITNGTPHSCHIIGMNLKSLFPEIKWVADFRDPWMEIDYFKDLHLSKKAYQKHEVLERKVLTTADAVTTVSPSWTQLFLNKGAKRVKTFTNGYPNHLHSVASHPSKDTILISHVGTLDEDRNPTQLFQALQSQSHSIQLKLIGPIAQEIITQTKDAPNISIQPKTIPHDEAIAIMRNSDALLLLNNQKGATKGRIPAKLFEYLALNKPIIYFGDQDCDAVHLLKKTDQGLYFNYEDMINLEHLLQWIKTPKKYDSNFIAQYSRESIAKKYHQFLNQL